MRIPYECYKCEEVVEYKPPHDEERETPTESSSRQSPPQEGERVEVDCPNCGASNIIVIPHRQS